MPDFPLEDIADYYTYLVHALDVSEDVFWNADIPFLDRFIENKTAYDQWMRSEVAKARERQNGK